MKIVSRYSLLGIWHTKLSNSQSLVKILLFAKEAEAVISLVTEKLSDLAGSLYRVSRHRQVSPTMRAPPKLPASILLSSETLLDR